MVLNNRSYYCPSIGRFNMKKQVFTVIIVLLLCMTLCMIVLSSCFNQNKQSDIVTTLDSDGDGLSDELERIFGTNVSNVDSDGDRVYDFAEIHNGTAVDTDGDGIIDALDPDDGDPSDVVDTDDDGIPDYLDTDDDNDGILTVVEQAYIVMLGSDVDHDGFPSYRDTDSDGDGKSDSREGTSDSDGDGIPNFLDENDNDGPLGDLDGDGVTNQEEGSMDPVPPDSNGDGVPDYLDPGSDGDSDGSSTEQRRFLGSWHNEANGNEHWIFYSNWTQRYTLIVTDNSPGEPFTAELRFTYTLNDSTFCQSILIGGDAPPSCYPYEFSEQDKVLTLFNYGEVMVVLIKD